MYNYYCPNEQEVKECVNFDRRCRLHDGTYISESEAKRRNLGYWDYYRGASYGGYCPDCGAECGMVAFYEDCDFVMDYEKDWFQEAF
ncbi:MAG: hypothetical protein M0R80_08400 [Proteobacteria bacterium]|jgi:hypothetical protein|nr:hypothetical protein [Pseudomonadota bacterium]